MGSSPTTGTKIGNLLPKIADFSLQILSVSLFSEVRARHPFRCPSSPSPAAPLGRDLVCGAAFHPRHPAERPHDVVPDRCELTKPDRTICTEFWCFDIQRDTFLSKPIPGDADLIILFLKIRVGEWHMEGLRIGYQLYGTVFGFFGSVNGRNDGECLLL